LLHVFHRVGDAGAFVVAQRGGTRGQVFAAAVGAVGLLLAPEHVRMRGFSRGPPARRALRAVRPEPSASSVAMVLPRHYRAHGNVNFHFCRRLLHHRDRRRPVL
jgi:hypothetical protein